MSNNTQNVSFVTAVLPTGSVKDVLTALIEDEHANALVSQARGSLLREHWWKAWMPSISPAKTKIQLLVPDQDLDRIVGLIVEHGRLHQQAAGAVFSLKSEQVYIGPDCQLIDPNKSFPAQSETHKLSGNLHVIFCVVSHDASERITKAAINAGAHGPVVHYAEGRGLRNRLGWLRITRDSEQEVLMIITDDSDVERIFDAIARAGELHLPGRGFMYRLEIKKGMFNLPSRQSERHAEANLQQIINAIDHLSGHKHWRDQSALQIGNEKNDASENLPHMRSYLRDRRCCTIVVERDKSEAMLELLLDNGAPGLNLSYTKLLSEDEENHLAHASVNQEYCVIRCVVNQAVSKQIYEGIESQAETAGLRDLCLLTHEVPLISTYNPSSNMDHRKKTRSIDPQPIPVSR